MVYPTRSFHMYKDIIWPSWRKLTLSKIYFSKEDNVSVVLFKTAYKYLTLLATNPTSPETSSPPFPKTFNSGCKTVYLETGANTEIITSALQD